MSLYPVSNEAKLDYLIKLCIVHLTLDFIELGTEQLLLRARTESSPSESNATVYKTFM